MHPDLERLIHLQQLEDAAEQARRTMADEPLRQQELADMLAAAQKALDDERARLAQNQAARRDIEKELAMQQGRLSKFKGQLMEVKTNREYQAMQKEIEVAQHEIQKQEDQLLERMLEFDEITAAGQAGRGGVRARQGRRRGAAQGAGRAARRRPGRAREGRRRPGRRSRPRSARRCMAMFERVLEVPEGLGRRRHQGRPVRLVPGAPAPADRQRAPEERDHLPVRELPAHPLLRGRHGAGRRGSPGRDRPPRGLGR